MKAYLPASTSKECYDAHIQSDFDKLRKII